MKKIITFLPGTYGTSLMRNHAMRGALAEMQTEGIPIDVIDNVKDSLDCNIYFFDNKVQLSTMFIILGCTTLVLIAVYILLNSLKKKTN